MRHLCFNKTLLASLLITSTLTATTLKDTVTQTVLTNSEIIANQLKIKSSQKEIDIEKSEYYPSLDFDTSFEKSQTKDKTDEETGPWVEEDGYIATLSATQLLYNGGKTSSKIKEKEYNYSSSSFKLNQKNEDIVFKIIKAYNDLVMFEELDQLMKYNNIAHANALEIAYNKEEISGEALETLKTQALITTQNDKKFEHNVKIQKAKALYLKLTSIQSEDNMCRPVINEEILPKTLKEIIELAVQSNYEIQEQKEIIKKQKQKVLQNNSNFKPTVELNLDASYDKDLELDEDGVQKKLSGTVDLKWNFYSGGKDSLTSSKERITLNEEKKQLEKITNDVIEKVTNLFNKYNNTITRIDNFNKSIKTNQEILNITKSQLEDGTKTFLDMLSSKSKIINAQTNKIKQEFILINTYYELLKELSMVTKTVINSKDQVCQNTTVTNLIKDEISDDKELDILLEETVESNTESADSIVVAEVSDDEIAEETIEDKLSKAFTNDKVVFDKENLSITLLITSESFNNKMVNPYDKFKYLLDSFSPKLINIISNNQKDIKSVNIESHTSSEHRKYSDIAKKFQANKGLSQRRANKVKQYFIKNAIKNNVDIPWYENNINAIGKSSQEAIINNGIEDKEASRRIIIKIIKR